MTARRRLTAEEIDAYARKPALRYAALPYPMPMTLLAAYAIALLEAPIVLDDAVLIIHRYNELQKPKRQPSRIVKFATLCTCGRRSREYMAWPTCRDCCEYTCPECDIPEARIAGEGEREDSTVCQECEVKR